MFVNSNKSSIPSQGLAKANSKKRVSNPSNVKVPDKSHPNVEVVENFSLLEAIRSSLDLMPDIRRDLVESGRELAADENYPSAESLDELTLLALEQFIEERKTANL